MTPRQPEPLWHSLAAALCVAAVLVGGMWL